MNLTDPNMHNVISKCYISAKRQNLAEIFVIYLNGARERIWTFNPMRYTFDYQSFIGKTKIEAVFYCDRKPPDIS